MTDPARLEYCTSVLTYAISQNLACCFNSAATEIPSAMSPTTRHLCSTHWRP